MTRGYSAHDLAELDRPRLALPAGALGVPVWIMLLHSADWRWLLDRNDSPWYATARLFRQPRPGDWDGVWPARCARPLR